MGEHAASILRLVLPDIIRKLLQLEGSDEGQHHHQYYDDILKVLNRVLIHCLFDIKHLMQHEVKI